MGGRARRTRLGSDAGRPEESAAATSTTTTPAKASPTCSRHSRSTSASEPPTPGAATAGSTTPSTWPRVSQIRYRHSPGRAYYERELGEGKTGKASPALPETADQRRHLCLPAGRRRPGSGSADGKRAREGNGGTTLLASAAGSHPSTGSSAKPLPDPLPAYDPSGRNCSPGSCLRSSRTVADAGERWSALLESVLGETPQGFESPILRASDLRRCAGRPPRRRSVLAPRLSPAQFAAVRTGAWSACGYRSAVSTGLVYMRPSEGRRAHCRHRLIRPSVELAIRYGIRYRWGTAGRTVHVPSHREDLSPEYEGRRSLPPISQAH